jgi:DNA-binding transcriptional MerR regulator
MKMQKRQFRIGELAKKLEVEKFVIRFWEKEFDLSTDRSTGGQRFYDENDLATFSAIKTLLYNQGFTISGAKKKLSDERILGSHKTSLPKPAEEQRVQPSEKLPIEDLLTLKKHLINLKELL